MKPSENEASPESSSARGSRKGFFSAFRAPKSPSKASAPAAATPGEEAVPKTRSLKRGLSGTFSRRKTSGRADDEKRAKENGDSAEPDAAAEAAKAVEAAAEETGKAEAKAAAEKELNDALSPGWFQPIDTDRLREALHKAQAVDAHHGLVQRASEKLAAEEEAARKKAEAEAEAARKKAEAEAAKLEAERQQMAAKEAEEATRAKERAAVNVQALARGNSGRITAKNEAAAAKAAAVLAAEKDAEEKVALRATERELESALDPGWFQKPDKARVERAIEAARATSISVEKIRLAEDKLKALTEAEREAEEKRTAEARAAEKHAAEEANAACESAKQETLTAETNDAHVAEVEQEAKDACKATDTDNATFDAASEDSIIRPQAQTACNNNVFSTFIFFVTIVVLATIFSVCFSESATQLLSDAASKVTALLVDVGLLEDQPPPPPPPSVKERVFTAVGAFLRQGKSAPKQALTTARAFLRL